MKKGKERFDYLLDAILNEEEETLNMELSKEEIEFFENIDLTEVLFI